MMGERLVMQESLFYEFRLEDHVPCDRLLRRIDRFVDCSGLRQRLAGYYSATGRPSVDPELMIRMLLIGYCLGIRSERRHCEELPKNPATPSYGPMTFALVAAGASMTASSRETELVRIAALGECTSRPT
jgi:hypothetical protein